MSHWEQALKSGNKILHRPIIDREGYTETYEGNKRVFMRDDQIETKNERHLEVQYNCNNIISTALQSTTTNPCDIIISRGQEYKVEEAILSFTVSVANAPVILCPAPLAINRIEIAGGGGSKPPQTLFGDHLLQSTMCLTKEQLKSVSLAGGYHHSYMRSLNNIPAGSTKTLYVPLIFSFFDVTQPWLGGINEDIRVRIYFTNAVESGTATNVTLTGCSLWLICKDIPDSDKLELTKYYSENVIESPILNTTLYSVPQAVNVGTEYKIPVNMAFQGITPMVIWGLRSSHNNTNAGKRTFAWLGDGGYWYLAGSDGKNISGGSNIPVGLSRYVLSANHCPSELFCNLPLIPIFHGEPISAFKGQKDGYFYYTGREQFVFKATAGNTETPEVQTLATYYNLGTRTAATPTSGNYFIKYRGASTPILAYDASAATILAALQSLDTVQNEGFTLAVSAALSAAGSFTITISNLNTIVPSSSGGVFTISPADLSDGTRILSAETAISTPGVLDSYKGAVLANGNYNIDFFVYTFQHVEIDHGQIKMYDTA